MTMYRHIGNGEPQVVQTAAPAELSLPELTAVADRAWTAVATGHGVDGYATALDGDEAVIRDVISPTRYTELRLRQTDAGIWYVTEGVQRPSFEDEGFAGTVRETRAYPLDGLEPTTRSKTFGRYQDGDLLFPEPDVTFGDPVTDQVCGRLLRQLREVLGEQPADIPRQRSWLGWLGLRRR